MNRILVLRHGSTEWSSQKRLQGRNDLPLSAAGRAQVRKWRIDPAWKSAVCLCSPLKRSRETAKILCMEPIIEPLLIEADWGEFEGRHLGELRKDPSIGMAELEAKGVDFCPPGGESPRAVVDRIRPLLQSESPSRQVWITHKGVRNACMILVLGWDMQSKPPLALRDDDALLLRVTTCGRSLGAEVVGLTKK